MYGEELSFTTLPVLAAVTTVEATDVEGTTAVSGGEVSADGGSAVTAYGVCYGIAQSDNFRSENWDGSGLGEFVSELSGMRGLTVYYARAYATSGGNSLWQ